MVEGNFEHPKTDSDFLAEKKATQAAAQGKWDAFNQPEVQDNGISREELDKLDKKHFEKEFRTTEDEIQAYEDYEHERDELLDQT